MKSWLQCILASACLPLIPNVCHAQSDPIAALLARYKLSRTPFDAEGVIVPGSLLVGGDKIGSMHILPYEISATAIAYSDASLQDMTVVPLESVDGGSTGADGGGLTVAKWAPGVRVTTATGMKSDQALFSVAEITSTEVDKLVLHQPEIEQIWNDWHKDNEAARNVWLVVSVFYTKELNVANSSQRQVALATGGKLPDCPASLPSTTPALSTTVPAAAGATPPVTSAPGTTPPGAQVAPAPATTPPTAKASTNGDSLNVTGKINGVDVSLGVTHPSTSKRAISANIQLGVAAATTVATTAANVATQLASGALITASGYSCRDNHDVAHLVSTTPIAIGVKVVELGHFTHHKTVLGIPTPFNSTPTGFTWDVVTDPPVFTAAK